MSTHAQGEVRPAPLPSQLEYVAHMLRGFPAGTQVNERQMNAIIRAADEVMAQMRRPSVSASDGMGLMRWLMSDDTGLSSRYMAAVLSGTPRPEMNYPRDPSDFGRCYRLLRAAPELRAEFEKLRACPKPWPLLVEHWAELEYLYELELPEGSAPRLYRRMQELSR